ncbi:MAG: hypothetical protein Q4G03_09630 [Planctomycetia bacterium]|nr:hypothetical protein [Planctomycetia bacterium]
MYPDDDQASALFDNIALRLKLKDYSDGTVSWLGRARLSLAEENDVLRAYYHWEESAISTVQSWFQPPLSVIESAKVSKKELADALRDLALKLNEKGHVLLFTDHISDRPLYRLIVSYILPSELKNLENSHAPIYWNFSYFSPRGRRMKTNDYVWLAYYASDQQRAKWLLDCNGQCDVACERTLPKKRTPKHRRDYLYAAEPSEFF